MLTSWFSQKPAQGSKDAEPQRHSIDVVTRPSASGNDVNLPRSSLDNPKASQPVFKTPHDAIIAQLQTPLSSELNKNEVGKSVDGLEDDRYPTSASVAASQSRVDLGLSPSPSLYTGATNLNTRPIPNQPLPGQPSHRVDLLQDPFDGSSQGILFPQAGAGLQDNAHHAPRINSASVAAASEQTWANLSKVLDLQVQIAKMHIDMEGLGAGDGRKKTKGKLGRGSSFREADRRVYHAVPSLRARAMSNASTIGTAADEKEVDEEEVGVTDEETQKNRAREEEFAKLANHLEGKKESINEIMNKVRLCDETCNDP